MPATDWDMLFRSLVARLSASNRAEWRPEDFAEMIRDVIYPKCLALFVGTTTSSDLKLAWAHGFDLPNERSVPRNEDLPSWLTTTTGLALFGRRAQTYVTPFGAGHGLAASLCVASRRRGRALVMEQMFVAAAAALVRQMRAVDDSASTALQPASSPASPIFEGQAPAALPGVRPTVGGVDGLMLRNLALAVENAREAVLITDVSGRIEYVNPAFERMTGYSRAEVVGQNPRILKSGVHPPGLYSNLWETILTGRAWPGTLVNRRKDGSLYEDERTIVPIRGDSGAITGFISVGEDVSSILQYGRERAALMQMSLAATGDLDLPVALQVILKSALQATAADGGAVVFVGRAKEAFGPPVCAGVLACDDSYAHASLETIGQLGTRQREGISVQSGHEIEGLSSLRAVAILPLRARGEVLGVASLVARRADAFPDPLHPIMESFANQASVTVTNALLHQDVLHKIKVLQGLGQLTRTLRVAHGLDDLLRLLVEEASRVLGATGTAVLLLDASQTLLSVRASRGPCTEMRGTFPLEGSLLGLPLKLGHDVIANQADLEEFTRLTGVSDLHTLALIPLSTSAGRVGLMVLGWQQPVALSPADLDLLAILSDVASTAIHRVRAREELEESYIAATLALAEATDARDSYVAGHAQRTGSLAEQVARLMDLPEDQVQDIRYGAILHDVGKVSIPDEILRKIGPLDAQEWQIIRRHTIAGARILAPVPRMLSAAKIVRHHHERWDGSGYPDGLQGEAIPLGARIVAVVDAYTAMLDERPYRKALSPEEALKELQRHAGTQLDPAVVEAFLRVVKSGEYL